MAGKYNFSIDQGTTLSKPIAIQSAPGVALGITGYTFRGQMREDYDSATVVAAFVITIVNAATGTIQVSLADTITAAIPAGIYLYDIEYVDTSGSVTRLLEGKITIRPEVTREQ